MLRSMLRRFKEYLRGDRKAVHSMSGDPSVKIDARDLLVGDDRIVFFQTRRDTGPFEIVRVMYSKKKRLEYVVVYSTSTGREFQISRYWFEVLFEKIEMSH